MSEGLTLYTLWSSYTAASSRSAANDMGLPPPGHEVIVGIDSSRFFKLCKDGKLLDSNFRKVDVDLVFTKFAKQRRLDYNAFQNALSEVAVKKRANGEILIENLLFLTQNGPSMHGSLAAPTRLHDDKSTYTGVYKAGGPTTIDYEKQTMDKLCDRTKRATVRGVPELAVYGPGGINVLMAPTLPCSPFVHLPAGNRHAQGNINNNTTAMSSSPAAVAGSAILDSSFEEKSMDYALDLSGEFNMGYFMASLNSSNVKEAILPRELFNQVKNIYRLYTAASSRSSVNHMNVPPPPKPSAQGIDSARFLKLLKDGNLINKHFHMYDVDVIFSKYADRRRLNVYGFQSALIELALKRNEDIGTILHRLTERTANGPTLSGSASEYTRLHDDKSTYTGVYKAGGPTTIDYEKQTMDQLCDRRKKATIRGTPYVMLHGPGDKFIVSSAHNQCLTNSQEYYNTRSKAHGYSNAIASSQDQQNDMTAKTPESVLGKYFLKKKQTNMFSPGATAISSATTGAGNYSSHGHSHMTTPHHVTIEFVDGMGISHVTDGADVGLNMDDMEITEEQLLSVQEIYRQYELHSRSFKEQQLLQVDRNIDVYSGINCGLDGSKFHKLCSDAKLFDKFFTRKDVDIIFTKHKASHSHQSDKYGMVRKLDFENFQNALLEISFKKGFKLGDLIDHISLRTAGGPTSTGTIAESNRFYDDKSHWTGAAAHGGGSNLNAGAEDSVFSAILDLAGEFADTAGSSPMGSPIISLAATQEVEEQGIDEDEIDMSVTALQLEDVRQLFSSFANSSKKISKDKDKSGASGASSAQQEAAIDSTRFVKLCNDGKLFEIGIFAKEEVDIMFAKYKSPVIKRRMDFDGFQRALLDIASRKKLPLGDLVDSLIANTIGGPQLNGTIAETNRFHDDKNTYTGQYSRGGADFRSITNNNSLFSGVGGGR